MTKTKDHRTSINFILNKKQPKKTTKNFETGSINQSLNHNKKPLKFLEQNFETGDSSEFSAKTVEFKKPLDYQNKEKKVEELFKNTEKLQNIAAYLSTNEGENFLKSQNSEQSNNIQNILEKLATLHNFFEFLQQNQEFGVKILGNSGDDQNPNGDYIIID